MLFIFLETIPKILNFPFAEKLFSRESSALEKNRFRSQREQKY